MTSPLAVAFYSAVGLAVVWAAMATSRQRLVWGPSIAAVLVAAPFLV